MGRVRLLLFFACLLVILNVVLWAREGKTVVLSSNALASGCGGCKAALPAGNLLQLAKTFSSVSGNLSVAKIPLKPCTGCFNIMTTTQVWCKMRPPNTECWIGPGLDNFRWERQLKMYQCGVEIGICCGNWVQNGCCNDAASQPQCTDQDADFTCEEMPDCP